jgi:hypothetical protein
VELDQMANWALLLGMTAFCEDDPTVVKQTFGSRSLKAAQLSRTVNEVVFKRFVPSVTAQDDNQHA